MAANLSVGCWACRSQAAGEPPRTGSAAAVAAVVSAASPGGAASGDRRLANLILADVAAIAALGRPSVLCALTDMQRLMSCAAAVHSSSQPAAATAGSQRSALQSAESDQTVCTIASEVTGNGHQTAGLPAVDADAPGQKKSKQHQGRQSKVEKRQLKLARTQIGHFFLPWANEQPPVVFAEVSCAAAEEWDRWCDFIALHLLLPQINRLQARAKCERLRFGY